MSEQPLIFDIGMNKTGTNSFCIALKRLGISCLHMNKDIVQAMEANKGTSRKCLCPLTDKYRAFCDSPIPYVFEQLDHDYPDSIYIITERNLDAWVRSRMNHFGGEPAYHISEYRRWETRLHDYFGERLDSFLRYDLCGGDGWGPLCKYLGLPVPNKPFPHKNKTTPAKIQIRRKRRGL